MKAYQSYLRTSKTLDISNKHELVDWDYSKYKIANLNLDFCKISKKLGEDFLELLDFNKTHSHENLVGNDPRLKSFKKFVLEFYDQEENKFRIFFFNNEEILLLVSQKNLIGEWKETYSTDFKSFEDLIKFEPIKNLLVKKSIIKRLTTKLKGE